MKKKLREEALAKRNSIPAEVRAEKSRLITKYILQSNAYKQAKTVFSFVSMGSEVETREILKQAWQDGKTVAVPKTEKGRKMIFLKKRQSINSVQWIFSISPGKLFLLINS